MVRPTPDEHTGNTLEAELLPDREPEPADVADVDDVIEATRDRAGEQCEDDEEPRARTVDSEEGNNRDKAEQRPAEGRRAFLGAVRRRAVRGDVLTRAEADEQADERRVEHHAGDEREHADDDRLSHGSMRQSSIIISATCFQIGAARIEPKRFPATTCGSLRMTIMVNCGSVAGMKPTNDATTFGP